MAKRASQNVSPAIGQSVVDPGLIDQGPGLDPDSGVENSLPSDTVPPIGDSLSKDGADPLESQSPLAPGDVDAITERIVLGTDGASTDQSIESLGQPSIIEIPARRIEAIEIKLPLSKLAAHEKTGYIGTHFEIRLTQRQARTLKSVYYGLRDMNAKMENGKHVERTAHAMRYILDLVADAYDSKEG